MENQILDEGSVQENFDQRVQNVLSNGYNFDLGRYISTGASILNKNVGSYIGFLLLFVVITVICGFIPFIGSLANAFILSPCLLAGFFIMSWRIHKNKSTDFSKFFSGFNFLGPLAVLQIMLTIIYMVIIIPYIFIAIGTSIWDIIDIIKDSQSGDVPSSEVIDLILNLLVKMIPLLVICWILQLLWSFSQYIVVFGKKNFWDAMMLSAKIVSKRFFHFLLFFIVIGLINIAGAIPLGLGLLYTIPLSICSMYASYELIVGTNDNDIPE